MSSAEVHQQGSSPGKSIVLPVVVVIAIALSVLAWFLMPPQFYVAYLAAVMLPWGISVGSTAMLCVYNVTGGKWGEAAWPWLVINARMMPLVAILFIPWAIGVLGTHPIYPWADPSFLKEFEGTANRVWYYQPGFYLGRTVLYFVVWTVIAYMAAGLPKRNATGDERRDDPHKMLGGEPAAGLGLIAIILSITWAGIDWVLSFDLFLASTLFGALVGIGAMLSTMAATVAAISFWKPLEPAARDAKKSLNDNANLMLTFLMIWAYFSFAHFLILWQGDLHPGAHFYAARQQGLWGWVTPAIIFLGFFLPFMCLFSQNLKQTPKAVGSLALFLLGIRLIELWWFILPGPGEGPGYGLSWAIIPTVVAVAGIYVLVLAGLMRPVQRLSGKEFAHVS